MAMMPAFQWGQGGQALTPEQAKRQRAVAEALMGVQKDPQNMWEGIQSAVGQIGGALQNTRLDAQEGEARAQVAQALAEAQASGDPNALLGVIGNDWASDAERQIASLLYEQSQPKDPLEVNGQLVDPNTFEVLGDFRNAPEAPKPLAINDQLVDPTTGKVIGDFRDPPAPGFAPLTAEEAASLGLPPGSYQRGPDNRIYEIGGGNTNVTVNTGEGSSQWNKTLDENNAKRYIGLQDEALGAQRALNSFAAMDQLLSDPNLYSGAGGEQVLGLKRLGAAMGLNPEGIQSAETFNALSKQAALDIMGGSLGTGFSNADRDFVIDQVANLGNTPAGNRQIVAIQRKLAQRKIEIAQRAQEYVDRNGQLDNGFDRELRQWAEANPLFQDEPGSASPGQEDVENILRELGL